MLIPLCQSGFRKILPVCCYRHMRLHIPPRHPLTHPRTRSTSPTQTLPVLSHISGRATPLRTCSLSRASPTRIPPSFGRYLLSLSLSRCLPPFPSPLAAPRTSIACSTTHPHPLSIPHTVRPPGGQRGATICARRAPSLSLGLVGPIEYAIHG